MKECGCKPIETAKPKRGPRYLHICPDCEGTWADPYCDHDKGRPACPYCSPKQMTAHGQDAQSAPLQ